jgi:hypothetical protein
MKRLALLTAIVIFATGCGGSSKPSSPAERIVQHAGSGDQIVLSALGAERIGLRTTIARSAGANREAIIPFSAVVYDPGGKTYAFASPAPLTYVEVPIVIDQVNGNAVYVQAGVRPGTRVVSTGAEELYGVQTGVLAQT